MIKKLYLLVRNNLRGLEDLVFEGLVLLALTVVILLLVAIPSFGEVRSGLSLEKEIVEDTARLNRKAERIKEMVSQYPDYEEMLLEASQHLPEDPRVMPFMNTVVEAAGEQGVSLENFKITAAGSADGDRTAITGLELLSFELKGTGGYRPVRSLVSFLKEHSREVGVVSFRLVRRQESILDFTLSGRIYSR